MYYEETWIGDSLFWRSSPNGKWNEFTIADYKTKVRQLEQQVKSGDLADVVEQSEQLVCHSCNKKYRLTGGGAIHEICTCHLDAN